MLQQKFKAIVGQASLTKVRFFVYIVQSKETKSVAKFARVNLQPEATKPDSSSVFNFLSFVTIFGDKKNPDD